jgi:Bacterial Ig-like domain
LRDTLPPVLVKSTPPDSGRNVRTNKITLEFDEYVQLQNAQQQVVISPVPKIMPLIESKLRTVTIRLKDSLEPNTTYSINFGQSLVDVDENNPMKNFTFIFSTGHVVDSGKLSGRVLMAENGKADSTLIVILYRDLSDTAVIKLKPRYFARLDKEGFFSFRYLANGKYNVFALKDADGSLHFDQPTEMIGFLDQPIEIDANSEPVKLYAFSEIGEGPRKSPSTQGTKPSTSKEDKRLHYSLNLDNNTLDILGDLQVKFDRKPTVYDTAKISLRNEKGLRVSPYKLALDSNILKITHAWIPGTKYSLLIEKDFAEDSLGNKIIRNDTIHFETKKEADYGSLRLRLLNLDTSLQPILLFYKGDELKKSVPLRSGRIEFSKIIPGEYDIRILFDRNRNGKWDTGNFSEKLQPEIVKPRKEKLNIRANWDNEVDINLQEVQNQG